MLILVAGFLGAAAPAPLHYAVPRDGHAHRLSLRCAGDRFELRDEGNAARLLATQPRDATSRIEVVGAPGDDDTLTVDWSRGFCAPQGGIDFDGGDGGFDTLVLNGGSFRAVTCDYVDAHSGDIVLADGTHAPVTVRYAGLEPVTISSVMVDLTFNVSAIGALPTLTDNGVVGDNLSRFQSGAGAFETTVFANPTGSLTIRDGYVDSVAVALGFESGTGTGQFHAALNIDASQSRVSLVDAIDVASVSITGRDIGLVASRVTTVGGQRYDGSVSLGGADPVTLTSTGSGDIVLGSVMDGGRTLLVNTAGKSWFTGDVGLGALVTDAPGTTEISARTVMNGDAVHFGDAVTLDNDVTVGSYRDHVTFDGDLTVGAHTLTLTDSAPVSLAGRTTLSAGSIVAANGVTVSNGGTLTGTTSVRGRVAVTNASALAPGVAGVGSLATGDLDLQPGSRSALSLDAAGTAPLAVTGAVSLGGAAVALTVNGDLAPYTPYALVDNDGTDAVVGTFDALPEGATFDVGGQTFQITYAGGDGNDVMVATPALMMPVVDAGVADTGGADSGGVDAADVMEASVDVVAADARDVVDVAVAHDAADVGDAGGARDAGDAGDARGDASADAGPVGGGGACGCRASGSTGQGSRGLALVLAASALVAARRRLRRSPATNRAHPP